MPIYRPSRALRVRTTATSSLIDTSWTIQHEGRDLLLMLCSPTQMHRQPTFSRVGASGSRCPKSESTRTLAAAEEDTRAIDRPLWTLTEPALSRSPVLPVKKKRNTIIPKTQVPSFQYLCCLLMPFFDSGIFRTLPDVGNGATVQREFLSGKYDRRRACSGVREFPMSRR